MYNVSVYTQTTVTVGEFTSFDENEKMESCSYITVFAFVITTYAVIVTIALALIVLVCARRNTKKLRLQSNVYTDLSPTYETVV